MATWYFTRNGAAQQEGPVTPEALKQMATAGELRPADQVWKEGMGEWVPASRIKGLFPSEVDAHAASGHAPPQPHGPSHAPAAGHASAGHASPPYPAASRARVRGASGSVPDTRPAGRLPRRTGSRAIGYYSPGAGIPGHYQPGLARMGAGTGPVGEWPLGPEQMRVVKTAGDLRRVVRAMAILYRILALLMLVATGFLLITLAVGATVGPRGLLGGLMSGSAGPVLAAVVAVYVGFTILFYACATATRKSRMWGPLVMGILFTLWSLGALYQLVSLFTMYSRYDGPAFILLVPILTAAVPIVLTVLSFKAAANCPRFLAMPRWVVATFGEASA